MIVFGFWLMGDRAFEMAPGFSGMHGLEILAERISSLGSQGHGQGSGQKRWVVVKVFSCPQILFLGPLMQLSMDCPCDLADGLKVVLGES